jgi:hypothetical protein
MRVVDATTECGHTRGDLSWVKEDCPDHIGCDRYRCELCGDLDHYDGLGRDYAAA